MNRRKNHIDYPKTKRVLPSILESICERTHCRQFGDIPASALDLVDTLLQTSPCKRPTAGKVLQHPFFEGVDRLSFDFPRSEEGGFHCLEVKRRSRGEGVVLLCVCVVETSCPSGYDRDE